MTKQDKELLLKDLCARLPYDMIINVNNGKYREDVKLRPCHLADINTWDVKPYLRPMSSMTTEERNEYLSIKMQETERVALAEIYRPEAISEIMDWLNSKHFDYRGLIDMGLALEAPEDMYKL